MSWNHPGAQDKCEPVSHHPAQGVVSNKRHPCPAGQIIVRKKLTIVVEAGGQIDTKTDGRPLLRRRHGMRPPGSAGVPPAQVLAQPRPSPPPGSTGNGARTLLRPGPCRTRRQGGRAVTLGGPSWSFVDYSFGRLFQASVTPALAGRSFEEETADLF